MQRFQATLSRVIAQPYRVAIVVALGLWALYARVGPGADFFGAYRWLVFEPGKLYGNYGIFSPPWLAPLMAPLVTLPGRAGYVLFLGATLAMLLYSSRVLRGSSMVLLLSAQVFWILWWGQIDGLAIFGLLVARGGNRRHHWLLLSAGLAIALTKPHVTIVPAIWLWWRSQENRWKCLAALAVLLLASLAIWGPWPAWVLRQALTMADSRLYGPWNASIGPLALPLLAPAILVRWDDDRRKFLALAATGLLVMPYMPYYSTALILCFPLPRWTYPFAFLGYLPSLISTQLAWNAVALLPVLVLAWLYAPLLSHWLRARLPGRKARRAPSDMAGGSDAD